MNKHNLSEIRKRLHSIDTDMRIIYDMLDEMSGSESQELEFKEVPLIAELYRMRG